MRLKAWHLLLGFAIVTGVVVARAAYVAESERGAAMRSENDRFLEQHSREVTPGDIAMAKQLRDRAAAIRRGREAFPDADKLAAAATDAKGDCAYPVPAMLRPLFVPIVELTAPSKARYFRVAGLAEHMDDVAKRLESTAKEPGDSPPRDDAAALLAAPLHEVMFILERVERPVASSGPPYGDPTRAFEPGSVLGRAVLVDVGAGVPLCAGMVGAHSSDRINVRPNPDVSEEMRAASAVDDDLWQQLTESIAKADMHLLKPTKKR